ncbi:MAG TPA: 50S ribosomal protein L15e [Patescibacteria group bacterium]|nr:50S ribosomal protein L15e [Patescibacteria group bacterium]
MANATEEKSVKKPHVSYKGMYHYIGQAWKKPDTATLRNRMTEWRKSDSLTKVEKPLRLDRARALGYKAKKGFVVIRVKLKRGGHKRPRPNKGRRSKRMHTNKNLVMNYRGIAEQRVAKKYRNLEVLNSYQIGKDGVNYFFEVIAVDTQRPEIKNDRTINWIAKKENRRRALRGLTSAAKKSRGLRHRQKLN